MVSRTGAAPARAVEHRGAAARSHRRGAGVAAGKPRGGAALRGGPGAICDGSTRSRPGICWSAPSPPTGASRWRTPRWRWPGPRSATTNGRKRPRRKAFELSSGLSREERLSVEGAYRETAREWTTRSRSTRRSSGSSPTTSTTGLRLANAQVCLGRAEGRAGDDRARADARGGRRSAHRPGRGGGGGNRVGLQAHACGGRPPRRRGEALGARLLVARARLLEGTAALRSANRTRPHPLRPGACDFRRSRRS